MDWDCLWCSGDLSSYKCSTVAASVCCIFISTSDLQDMGNRILLELHTNVLVKRCILYYVSKINTLDLHNFCSVLSSWTISEKIKIVNSVVEQYGDTTNTKACCWRLFTSHYKRAHSLLFAMSPQSSYGSFPCSFSTRILYAFVISHSEQHVQPIIAT